MGQPGETVTIERAMEIAREHQFHGRLAEAEGVLRQVVMAAPGRVEAANELAMVLGEQGKLEEAAGILQRVIALSPGYLPAWHNLAVASEKLGRYGQAVAYLRRGAEIAPWDGSTRYRLGMALKKAGQIEEAMREVKVSLDLNPNDVEAQGLYANFLLMYGDFARGWDGYEVRWKCTSFPDERRAWSDIRASEVDLRKKRVVVFGEQGFGDMIQFSRYCKLLAEKGAEVTAVVPADVATVIGWEQGVSRVISAKKGVAGDYVLPMMSLPRVMGTRLETIPAQAPYVTPPAELVEKWRKRMEGYGGLRVGIAWAGRPEHKQDRERSIRLAQFAALGAVEGATLFMLQKGSAAAEANPAPAGMKVINLTAGIADFADTAGLIANLDLVIAVDTAVVHLAGAMAKPVWTLLAAVPDFRWMLERADSPWYPTMKLFRQKRIGEWDEVFERVAEELKKRVEKSRGAK